MFQVLHVAQFPGPFFLFLSSSLSLSHTIQVMVNYQCQIYLWVQLTRMTQCSWCMPLTHLLPWPVLLPQLVYHITLPLPSYLPLLFFFMEILFNPFREAISATSDSASIPFTSHKLHYVVDREMIIRSIMRRQTIDLFCWVFPYTRGVW